MLYLGVLVFSYFVFVFVSDNLNPFAKVKTRVKRRRWKLGRKISLAVLVSGLTALLLGISRDLGYLHQIIVFLLMATFLILPVVIRYHRSQLWR